MSVFRFRYRYPNRRDGLRLLSSVIFQDTEGHILKWTLDALTQDRDLDRFFNCVSSFYHSNPTVVKDPRQNFARLRSPRLSWLWKHSYTVLRSRLIIWQSRTKSNKSSRAWGLRMQTLSAHRIPLQHDWHKLSVKMGYSPRTPGHKGRTGDWFSRTKHHSPSSLRMCREATTVGLHGEIETWYLARGNENVIHHPPLQSSVISTWLKVVSIVPAEAQISGQFSTPAFILRGVRRYYVKLHPDTADNPDMFHMPSNPDHRPPVATTSIPSPYSTITTSPSPISRVSVTSSAPTGGLHSPVDSSMNQSDRLPHGPASSSPLPITDPSCIAPQAVSFSAFLQTLHYSGCMMISKTRTFLLWEPRNMIHRRTWPSPRWV